MMLLDTNALVDLAVRESPFHPWAASIIKAAVGEVGAAISPITVAELIAGSMSEEDLKMHLADAGIVVDPIPPSAAPICGMAYRAFRAARRGSGGGEAIAIPLPDFFIGAHAHVRSWSIATRDPRRFRTYFPRVPLLLPPD